MNEMTTICIRYNGSPLATIEVANGENMNVILAKINDKIAEIKTDMDLTGLNVECLPELDPQTMTREDLDQVLIDKLCNHETRLDDVDLDLANLPNLILGTTVNIDLRELTGVNNDCVPAAPITLGALLGIFAQQIQDLKKKDYTENSCDEQCGAVTSASGAFVACFASPDRDGDFDASDFFDQIYYADFPNP